MKRLFLIAAILMCTLTPVRSQYDTNRFMNLGRQALIDGKYATAIDNFNILLRLNTRQYNAYFFRGIAKYNLGDYTGAERDFDQALLINPIYTPAYHYRAIARSMSGKYESALSDLERAVELRPDYYGLYFSRGVTHLLSQQFEKAIEDFNMFIKCEPKEVDAYLNRGASYLYSGDTLASLKDYDKAITLNSFEPEGYIRRSRVYSLMKRYDEALSDLDRAVELDSTNSFAYFNRSIIRFETKDIEGAMSDIGKVIDADPKNALALYNRAIMCSQTGDWNRALSDYDAVISINPGNVLAYYNRAMLLTRMERYEEAVDDLSQAIDLYPDFAKAYLDRSYLYGNLGKEKEAYTDYQTAKNKIEKYRSINENGSFESAMADTSGRFESLLALDSDFAKRDFNENLLQNRDVEIASIPFFTVNAAGENLADSDRLPENLAGRFSSALLSDFLASIPAQVSYNYDKESVVTDNSGMIKMLEKSLLEEELSSEHKSKTYFAIAVLESESRQFNKALESYDMALVESTSASDSAIILMNRGALKAGIIDFISSIESNVRTLSLDNAGTARARVRDNVVSEYDYSDAIADMRKAVELLPQMPYFHYNIANLLCKNKNLPEAVAEYTEALRLYPEFQEAYYNRALIHIYIQEREKGCIDLSKAGELGIKDAYSVIKKYCSTNR